MPWAEFALAWAFCRLRLLLYGLVAFKYLLVIGHICFNVGLLLVIGHICFNVGLLQAAFVQYKTAVGRIYWLAVGHICFLWIHCKLPLASSMGLLLLNICLL